MGKRSEKQFRKAKQLAISQLTMPATEQHPYEETKEFLAEPPTAEEKLAQEEAFMRQQFDYAEEQKRPEVRYAKYHKETYDKFIFQDKSLEVMTLDDVRKQAAGGHEMNACCTSNNNFTYTTLKWDQKTVRLALCLMALYGVSAKMLIEKHPIFTTETLQGKLENKIKSLLCQNSIIDVSNVRLDVEKLGMFNRGVALLCSRLQGPQLQKWSRKGRYANWEHLETQEEANERCRFVRRCFEPSPAYLEFCGKFIQTMKVVEVDTFQALIQLKGQVVPTLKKIEQCQKLEDRLTYQAVILEMSRLLDEEEKLDRESLALALSAEEERHIQFKNQIRIWSQARQAELEVELMEPTFNFMEQGLDEAQLHEMQMEPHGALVRKFEKDRKIFLKRTVEKHLQADYDSYVIKKMVSFDREEDNDFGWVDQLKKDMPNDVRYARGGVVNMNNSQLFLLDLFYQTKPEHQDWFGQDPETRFRNVEADSVMDRPTHIRYENLLRSMKVNYKERIALLPKAKSDALRATASDTVLASLALMYEKAWYPDGQVPKEFRSDAPKKSEAERFLKFKKNAKVREANKIKSELKQQELDLELAKRMVVVSTKPESAHDRKVSFDSQASAERIEEEEVI